MVTGELEADHQVVSSAQYFAALRRISRSTRSRLFSRSGWRIRSGLASLAVGDEPASLAATLVSNCLYQYLRVERLIPSSFAALRIEASGLASSIATASRLNCSV